MSANKKRRSSIIIIHNNNNDMKSSHQLQQQQQQQMAAQKDMPSVCDMTQARREEEGVEIQKNIMLEMPRVCRCCCKGDMELLSLFEAAGDELINSSRTTKKSQRRRNNLATTSNEQQQHRKSVNPVEYALSGAHSSMDTVREEMIIWMLNVSTLLFSLTLKQQCPNACSTYIYIHTQMYLLIYCAPFETSLRLLKRE